MSGVRRVAGISSYIRGLLYPGRNQAYSLSPHTPFNSLHLNVGDKLAGDRFKIVADQSSIQETYPAYRYKQHTYIAEDTRADRPRCLSLRVLGPEAAECAEVGHELKIVDFLSPPGLHQHLLAPRETFWHEDKNGRHLCMVYDELFGPDLWFQAEVTGPEECLYPSSMIRKIAKQALQSLQYLHSQEISHGGSSPHFLPIYGNAYPVGRSRPDFLGFYLPEFGHL